jgi:hypothetical protein
LKDVVGVDSNKEKIAFGQLLARAACVRETAAAHRDGVRIRCMGTELAGKAVALVARPAWVEEANHGGAAQSTRSAFRPRSIKHIELQRRNPRTRRAPDITEILGELHVLSD